jgi:phage shock protein E
MNYQKFLVSRAAMALGACFGVLGVVAADGLDANPAMASVKHVNAEQAQKLMADTKVVVLDLRTPAEFTAGHLAGATNIDFYATGFELQLAALNKGATYLVYCASGNRSTQALPVFKKLQFQSLCHLDGGFKSWQKAGLPVQK